MQRRTLIVFAILVVCIGLIFLISILFRNKEKFIHQNTAIVEDTQATEPNQEKPELDQILDNIE